MSTGVRALELAPAMAAAAFPLKVGRLETLQRAGRGVHVREIGKWAAGDASPRATKRNLPSIATECTRNSKAPF